MNDDSQYTDPEQFKAQLLQASNQPTNTLAEQEEKRRQLLALGCSLQEIAIIMNLADETARQRAEVLMSLLERQEKAFKKQVRLKKKRDREEEREWQIKELMNETGQQIEEPAELSEPWFQPYTTGQSEPVLEDNVLVDNLREIMARMEENRGPYPEYIEIIEEPARNSKNASQF